jgi:lipoate-protein ligase B
MVTVSEAVHLCRAFRLGTISYEDALTLQNNLAKARGAGQIGDTLLLLQHPPVITIGRSGKVQNVLVPEATLKERNIKVIFTDRGGDVTYHGPGQLVVYPILDIKAHGLGVPGYVWNLEEVVIRVLAHYGITACRVEKLRGVWVDRGKIAALGVHLSRWISRHGLALNVNTDLDPFRLINPCGITDRPVISMAKILGRNFPMEEIESLTIRAFTEVFHFSLDEQPLEMLEPYR